MQLRNNTERYGLVARALHWLVAPLVPALFALGLYMRTLTYYDPLYRTLPEIHQAAGLVLFALLLARIAWRFADPPPPPIADHSPLERRAARGAHRVLYLLLLAMVASGYLISTADGRPLAVFDIEVLPSVVRGERLEDTAGEVHLTLAVALMTLAALHALAALKHHFMDRDGTLRRML